MDITKLGLLLAEFGAVKNSLRTIYDELPNNGRYDALKARIYGSLTDVIRSESDLKFVAQNEFGEERSNGNGKAVA